MTDTQTNDTPPEMLRRTWPEISAGTWRRITPLRWQAPHPFVDDAVLLVVIDQPEPTHATGSFAKIAPAEAIRRRYAELRVGLMQDIAHRTACEDGTPVIHPDHPSGLPLCRWCGAPDSDEHTSKLKAARI